MCLLTTARQLSCQLSCQLSWHNLYINTVTQKKQVNFNFHLLFPYYLLNFSKTCLSFTILFTASKPDSKLFQFLFYLIKCFLILRFNGMIMNSICQNV